MVACLERTYGNADFHKIVDFLTTSPIHYALTVSPTIYASYIEQFWNTAHSQTINNVKQIHAIVDGKTVVISKSLVRSDLYFNDEDGITCLTNETIFENLALMGYESDSDKLTFQKALFSPQWKFERASKHSYDSLLPGVNTPGSDEERIEHQELTDNIPPTPHDLPILGGYTPGSDEGRPGIHELIAICTKLSDRVLDLEKEKDAQAVEILKLKNIIKKLERKAKSSIPPPKRRLYKQVDSSDDSLGEENASKQGRNDISTAGDAITAASVIPDIDTARSSNVSAAGLSTSTVGDIFEDEMMTIADTLVAIRSTRPRTTSVVIRDVEEEPRRATPVPIVQSQDKEQRIARERAAEQEAKDAALIEQMEDVQARMDADILLAERLQQEEREQFTIKEKSRMLVDMIAERKRFFVA
ncbi:hypothetical protein Tco_1314291 [Tanacetum coccineum]